MAAYPMNVCFMCASVFPKLNKPNSKCKTNVKEKNTDTSCYKVLFKYLFSNYADQSDIANEEFSEKQLFKDILKHLQQEDYESCSEQLQFCFRCRQMADDVWNLRKDLEAAQIKIVDKVKLMRQNVVLGARFLNQSHPTHFTEMQTRFQNYVVNNETWLTSLEPDLWISELMHMHLEVQDIVKEEPPDVDDDVSFNVEMEEEHNYDEMQPNEVFVDISDNLEINYPQLKLEHGQILNDPLSSNDISIPQIDYGGDLQKPISVTAENPSRITRSKTATRSASKITSVKKPPIIKRTVKKEVTPKISTIPKGYDHIWLPETYQKFIENGPWSKSRSLLQPVQYRKRVPLNLLKCRQPSCKHQHEKYQEIEVHMQTHETSTKYFECPDCDLQFTTEHLYWIHMRYHVHKIKCGICSKPVIVLEMKKHLEETHQKQVLPCPACSYVFGDFMDLLNHVTTIRLHGANGLSLPCGLCSPETYQDPDIANNRYQLFEHLYEVHDMKHLKLSCDEPGCTQTFFGHAYKKQHMRTHLSMNEPVQCPYCDKIKTTRNIQTHIDYVHNKQQMKCDYCSESFETELKLNRHRVEVHGASKQKCDLCDKEFISKEGLLLHRRKFHGIGFKARTVKQFTCPTCSAVFTGKNKYQRHLYYHSDARDFSCEICGFSTKSNELLKRHMKNRHNPKRKMKKCPHCEKMFFEKYFSEHLRIHSKVRAFVCDICGSSYTQRAPLSYHIKTQHEGAPKKVFKKKGASSKSKGIQEPQLQLQAEPSAVVAPPVLPASTEPIDSNPNVVSNSDNGGPFSLPPVDIWLNAK